MFLFPIRQAPSPIRERNAGAAPPASDPDLSTPYTPLLHHRHGRDRPDGRLGPTVDCTTVPQHFHESSFSPCCACPRCRAKRWRLSDPMREAYCRLRRRHPAGPLLSTAACLSRYTILDRPLPQYSPWDSCRRPMQSSSDHDGCHIGLADGSLRPIVGGESSFVVFGRARFLVVSVARHRSALGSAVYHTFARLGNADDGSSQCDGLTSRAETMGKQT